MTDQLKLGNIVSPNGASIIFGAESTDNNLDILTQNYDTYAPYNIVVVEEDDDESIPAEQVTFSPGPSSNLTSSNAQSAISELEQIVYNSVPVFTQETYELTANQSYQSLSKQFTSSAMMVYYNGLLINESIHFNFSNNAISLIGFSAEVGDILTVIGLAAGGSGGANINAAALIGGSY